MDDQLDDLERFYELAKNGMRVDEFLRRHAALFLGIHSAGLTRDHRLGKGHLKRLRDEITPAARFVRQYAAPDDEIRFPLDCRPHKPDCIVSHRNPARERTIQITLAQGKERYFLMDELNETGSGRGYLGLTEISRG